MNAVIRDLLTNAHELTLVIDGVTIALTVGSQSLSDPSSDGGSAEVNIFRLDRGIWKIRFNGLTVERRRSIGLAHTHELVRHPYVYIPSAELWIHAKGDMVEAKSEKEFAAEGYREAGLFIQSDRGEPVMTPETRSKVEDGLRDAERDLADCEADGDEDRAAELRASIAKIKDYLNKATFAGRVRRFDGPAGKARKRVSVAIARAIADLETEHPALARHLDNSIHTGKECRYAPETDVKWIL